LLSRIILPTAANQSPPRRAHTELTAAGATGVLFFSQDPPRLDQRSFFCYQSSFFFSRELDDDPTDGWTTNS